MTTKAPFKRDAFAAIYRAGTLDKAILTAERQGAHAAGRRQTAPSQSTGPSAGLARR
jgi:hypothetical protein